MKLKQLITGGALAATVLTLGSAQAEQSPYDGIVFCKAQITEIRGNASDLSVTLPFTTTGYDGKEYTYWNLGEIPPRGVADSWHSEKGPGKFVAHNNGRVGAYIYLTSSQNSYATNWYSNDPRSYPVPSTLIPLGADAYNRVFGENNAPFLFPASSLGAWLHKNSCYCLAFTTDMEAKNPTWHMLNHWSDYAEWHEDDGDLISRQYIGGYMGYLHPGEFMPFDVKFWSPGMIHMKAYFTFKVEAASFPLWEHDLDVQ